MTNLTEGACLLHTPTPDFPVVQVLSIQKLPNSHLQRHRLVVSDGVHFRSALLAIHLNQLIQSQEISALCLIQMKDFVLTIDQAEGTEQATSLFIVLEYFLMFLYCILFLFCRGFFIADVVVVEKRQEMIGNPQRLPAANNNVEQVECLNCQSKNTTRIGCGHYFCCECISEQGCELCGMLASVSDAEAFLLQ